MGELGFNKIFGAILAAVLVVMGLREVSAMFFHNVSSHAYEKEYASANEWAEKNFAFRVDIPELGAATEIIEEIYDLGLLLLNADANAGARSFRAKCASCHTIEQGGSNGTGPNLYNIMGADKQAIPGFGYSGALSNTSGNWSWENMDAWLENPSNYARGTSMAFAGLNRDKERANVLAYLATYGSAPAMPEPLPPVEEESVEGEATDAEGDAETVEEPVEE
ncbi:MAG: c-type cytochrome [Pseudomonadota bacterium]